MSLMRNIGAYYRWADTKVIELLSTLSEEEFNQESEGSKKSIAKLIQHLVLYYEINLHTYQKGIYDDIKLKLSKMDQSQLLTHWKEIIIRFEEILFTFPDTMKMPTPDMKILDVPAEVYIFSTTDHSTYHRGQIILLYKEITNNEAVSTDHYSFITRSKE
ncbi:MAG: hypothetical protein OEZ01_06640 [Candidatus Heimdallarchaeota archaeon]|nr:hypothetical protein [Candidatus Heimdallarchaeota archaeon]MDH5645666.1 hypothetical protein [Candidatus Heimdallarchaeota archaeon]